MPVERYLIVNADDFGQSPGVNQGIIQAHREGIVTSASLMVRWPAAKPAAELARNHPDLSLGLHIDLGEWAFRDEQWVSLYEVVAGDDAAAVADEVARQVEMFRTLVGRNPTHIDSHQHVHRAEPVRSILQQLCGSLKVPLRHFSRVRYCGDFYGQTGVGQPYPEGLAVERLITTIAALPAGITELGCHPGLGDDVDSIYRTERADEIKALCDRRIRDTLLAEGIELRSFRDFNSLKTLPSPSLPSSGS